MLYETRWPDTINALKSITTITTRYNPSGIAIHFLNDPSHDTTGITSPEDVTELFFNVAPVEGGSTPLGARLDVLLREYLDVYRTAKDDRTPTPKPLNVIAITDGEATDDPESVIVSIARELDRLNAPLGQVGVQLFQVGGDEDAREFLRGLDDDLVAVYGVRDMVDTTPYRGGKGGEGKLEGEEMLKVLVGAVNRRVDRRENVWA